MKKLIAIGASSSKNSINKTFATFVATQVQNTSVETLDLNDFEMPLYSVDREGETGIPEAAKTFYSKIASSDGIVISLAEHNGSYTAAFKNLLDWTSRVNQKLWQNKPLLLLATSPGPRGATTVLEAAKQTFPHLGGQVISSFSLPSYSDNFESTAGVKNSSLNESLQNSINEFQKAVDS